MNFQLDSKFWCKNLFGRICKRSKKVDRLKKLIDLGNERLLNSLDITNFLRMSKIVWILSNLTFENHFNFKMACVNRQWTMIESDENENSEKTNTYNRDKFYTELKNKFDNTNEEMTKQEKSLLHSIFNREFYH